MGDIALVSLANTLTKTARDSDIICRWGGEEFLILVPNTNTQELLTFAQRLRKTVEGMLIQSDKSPLNFNITISIGISISTQNNVENIENVIYIADKNLYKAKKSGRNCVVS